MRVWVSVGVLHVWVYSVCVLERDRQTDSVYQSWHLVYSFTALHVIFLKQDLSLTQVLSL